MAHGPGLMGPGLGHAAMSPVSEPMGPSPVDLTEVLTPIYANIHIYIYAPVPERSTGQLRSCAVKPYLCNYAQVRRCADD